MGGVTPSASLTPLLHGGTAESERTYLYATIQQQSRRRAARVEPVVLPGDLTATMSNNIDHVGIVFNQ